MSSRDTPRRADRRGLRVIDGDRARSPQPRPIPPPSDEVGDPNPPDVKAHVQQLIDEISSTATDTDDP